VPPPGTGHYYGFSGDQRYSKDSRIPATITQNYLSYDTTTEALVPASRELFQLPFGLLVAAFC
jgi:hypothetical protein